jgi:cytochrome P450
LSRGEVVEIPTGAEEIVNADGGRDSAPLKTAPLGLPLLWLIRKDPLGAACRLKAQFGDVAQLAILFRRIYYFFTPEASREILVDHHNDFTREARLLKKFQSFQGRNALTTEAADWERQRRILTPGFSSKRIAQYMSLMVAATRDCLRSELPAEPGDSALLDVGQLTTHLTMDVILRTLFSHAATRAQAATIFYRDTRTHPPKHAQGVLGVHPTCLDTLSGKKRHTQKRRRDQRPFAAAIIWQYDLSLDEGATLPAPVVDLALKPKTIVRVRFTRR